MYHLVAQNSVGYVYTSANGCQSHDGCCFMVIRALSPGRWRIFDISMAFEGHFFDINCSSFIFPGFGRTYVVAVARFAQWLWNIGAH